MEHLSFIKMHGAGNDFVIIDCRNKNILDEALVVQIADRHFGIGCDQLIVLYNSPQADVRIVFYNADGSKAGACGNGTRCVAGLLIQETGKDNVTLETQGGILNASGLQGGMVAVDMGVPQYGWQNIPLSCAVDNTLELPIYIEGLSPPAALSMGNPHCVFFVDDVENIPLEILGPQIENNPLFSKKTNVEFVQVVSKNTLRMRVWERGAGITLACGSGACAALAVGFLTRRCAQKMTVRLDGGELDLAWDTRNHIIMTGPTCRVFDGRFYL